MKNLIFALAALAMISGCDALSENSPARHTAEIQIAPASTDNCVTTGANSPIVTGQSSVVVIDGQTYKQGQNTDCAPASSELATHGASSPIVTGEGATVIITTDR